ncbi:hypothetical protein TNCV_503981 [Trichonephila clavipes]|nr:hypothetical protein TNCV_503981 [Trichonephila clavipes]
MPGSSFTPTPIGHEDNLEVRDKPRANALHSDVTNLARPCIIYEMLVDGQFGDFGDIGDHLGEFGTLWILLETCGEAH